MLTADDRAAILDLVQRTVAETVPAAIDATPKLTMVPGIFLGTDSDGDGVVRLDTDDPTRADASHIPVIGPHPNYGSRVAVILVPPMSAFVLGEVIIAHQEPELYPRVVLDTPTGSIRFVDAENNPIGALSTTDWSVGTPGSALTRIDPIGGIRLRDDTDMLRAQLSPYEGLTLREPTTGVSGAILRDDGLIVIDPDTGDSISITSGSLTSIPTPKWGGEATVLLTTTTTHGSAAADNFGTSDDLDIRFVTAADWTDIGAQSYSPPSGYTERTDVNDAGPYGTLATSTATKDPAGNTLLPAMFTTSWNGWWRANGHTVVVRGGGAVSPSFRSVNADPVMDHSETTIFHTIAYPAGIVEGDLLLAFVAIMSSGVPIGWSVPPGWVQLGVQVAGLGTPHILSSGVWYKQAGASEPASAQVTINMSGAVATKIHSTAMAIQHPYMFPGGLDIRRNNRSMPRGLIAMTESTTDSGPWANANFPLGFETIPATSVLAGRKYRITWDLPIYDFVCFGDNNWTSVIELSENGGAWFWWHRTQRRFAGVNISSRDQIHLSRVYEPAANGTVAVRVVLYDEGGGGGMNVTIFGSASYRRTLDIVDEGAVY